MRQKGVILLALIQVSAISGIALAADAGVSEVGQADYVDGAASPPEDGGVLPSSDGGSLAVVPRPAEPTTTAVPRADWQPPSREPEIGETVVTATRRAEVVMQSPRSASAIGRQEIDERATRTVPEALESVPGVFVQQSNHGGGAPFIRGQMGNRVLLLVDGIRLNNSTYRSGPNQYLNTIDPFSVDQIEVLRGLGSTANGSDAIGGTINVLTEAPQLGQAGRPRGQLRLRGGSADRSGSVSVRGAWSGEGTGVVATATARHFGDLRAGGGVVQPFTGYDEWSGMLSGAWEPRPGRRLTMSLQSTRQYDVPRTDRSFPRDFRLFSLQARQLGYLRYDDVTPRPWVKRLRATASWTRQTERIDRYRIDRDAQIREEAVVDTGGLQVELDIDARAPSGAPVTTGVDVFVDRVRSDASEGLISDGGSLAPRPENVRYPNGVGYATAAVFVLHDFLVTERFRMTAEGRVGAVRLTLPRDDRLGALLPGAALPPLDPVTEIVPVYAAGLHARRTLGAHLAASSGVALGFRAPNVDDYARLGAEGPAFVVPTRGLRPERALSGEVGLKGSRARLRFSAAYAYTHIFDALTRGASTIAGLDTLDDLPVARVQNVESAAYHSVELAAVVPLWRQLLLSGGGAFTHGAVTTDGPTATPGGSPVARTQPANKVPPTFGRVALGWHAPANLWFVETSLRFALRQQRLGEGDLTDTRICPDVPGRCEGTPAWASFGLRAGLRVASVARVIAVFDNITDARYRLHASGVDAPGRSMTAMFEGYF